MGDLFSETTSTPQLPKAAARAVTLCQLCLFLWLILTLDHQPGELTQLPDLPSLHVFGFWFSPANQFTTRVLILMLFWGEWVGGGYMVRERISKEVKEKDVPAVGLLSSSLEPCDTYWFRSGQFPVAPVRLEVGLSSQAAFPLAELP